MNPIGNQFGRCFNMSSLAPLKELQLAAAEAKVPEIEAKVAEARQQRKAAAEAAAAEAAAAEVEAQAAAMEVGDHFMTMVLPQYDVHREWIEMNWSLYLHSIILKHDDFDFLWLK